MKIPLPKPNADTEPFWTAAKQGQLIYQYCQTCDKTQFYPRSVCVKCQDNRLEWRQSAGHGKVASFTEVMRAPNAAFKEKAPYIIALLDLDEGFRIMVNIIESDRQKLAIGARARIVFREIDGMILPQGVLA